MNGMNSGAYVWQIKGTQLNQILNAKIGDRFQSKSFKIANLTFRVDIYPNGENKSQENSFMFFIILESLPPSIEKITFCTSRHCQQTMSTSTGICTRPFQNSFRAGWPNNVLLLSELKQIHLQNELTSLDLIASVHILRIYIKHSSPLYLVWLHDKFNQNTITTEYTKLTHIIWNIDENTMHKFKTSNSGKQYESQIVDNMWYIACTPNGTNQTLNGYVGVYICISWFPPEINTLKAKFQIKCLETSDEYSAEKQFTLNDISWGSGGLMKTTKIAKYSSLTLIADIEIVEEMKEEQKEQQDATEIDDQYRISKLLKQLNTEQKKEDNNNNEDIDVLKAQIVSLSEQMERKDGLISKLETEIASLRKAVADVNHMKSYIFDEEKKDDGHNQKEIRNVTSELLSLRQRMTALQQQINNITNTKPDQDKASSKKEQLREWLRDVVDLEEYFDVLVENGFDELESVATLTINELNLIGIQKLGHKMKLLRYIVALKKDDKVQGVEYNEGNTAYI